MNREEARRRLHALNATILTAVELIRAEKETLDAFFEEQERMARGEPMEAIARALGTSGTTVREKAERLGLRRATFMPAASATPEGANAPRRLPACLPIPPAPRAVLPAIAALLEAA